MRILFILLIFASNVVSICRAQPRDTKPLFEILLTGHRGAPKHFPEHTLPSYGVAMREGMDLIEPDLVITKDGHLVCMHDLELSSTTNVASFPEFADRKTSVTLGNNKTLVGWLVSDFTLAEVKRLKVNQRVPAPRRDHFLDGMFEVPTLDEMIQFVHDRNVLLGTTAGLYIEMKHTPFFNQRGLFFEKALIDTLIRFGYEIFDPVQAKKTPVLIQSFDQTALKRLREEYKVNLRLVQLVDEPDWLLEDYPPSIYSDMLTADGLDKIAAYADILAPWKRYFYTFDEITMARLNWTVYRGSEIVSEARRRGMQVHTWTIRNKYEDAVLNSTFGGSPFREMMYLLEMGLDGLFTESPAEALIARDQYIFQIQSSTLPPGAFLGLILLVGVILGALATARRVDGHIGPSLKPPSTQVITVIQDKSGKHIIKTQPAESKKEK